MSGPGTRWGGRRGKAVPSAAMVSGAKAVVQEEGSQLWAAWLGGIRHRET